MPFVISWLPALGLSWLADEGFHQWMVGVCFALAVAAVMPGYRRHRRLIVPVLAIAGVSVLATGAFAIEDECCQQAAADNCCEDPAIDHSASTVFQKNGSENDLAAASPVMSTVANPLSPNDDSEHAACCHHGEHQAVAESEIANQNVSIGDSTWLSWFSRLITPAGGLLLVAAHLMNRRCCTCCERAA